MRKNFSTKVLVIGLIFLFLGASATLGVSANQAKMNTRSVPVAMDRSWSDNFDSYTNGQMLDGTGDDGGWKGWDNAPAAGAPVSNAQSHSSPQSVKIDVAADLVHEYTGYTTGQWVYTTWQYVPSDLVGLSYFILLSDYTDGAGQDNKWAVQVHFDNDLGVVESEFDALTLPLITGQWVEIRVAIDFEADWFQFYYDGDLLVEKAWTAGPNGVGDGFLSLDAVDLFANGASPVYYDDMSLVPPEFACDAGGPYVGEINKDIQLTGFASGGTQPYTWAWTFGDGNTSTLQNPKHNYTTVGVYNVTLTVTDSARAVVTDETTATITLPQPVLVIESISGGIGISAVIKNTGTGDAIGVSWTIALDGGIILLGKTRSGTVDIIAAGESVTVKDFVFGFGKTTINVTAGPAEKTATGTVILFFVLKVT